MPSFLALAPWIFVTGLAVALVLLLRRARQRETRRAAELAATEAKLKRLVQAVDSASDAIGIGDMESNSLFHNKSHVELFGYSVDHLNAAAEPAALFADKTVARQIHQSIRAGCSWHGETDIKDRNGRVFPAFVRADIIRDDQGAPTGIFGVFTDITERRRQEDAIRASQESLRRTNLELATAAEEARRLARIAQAANEAKSAFLATMSHEIRTPLNGVLGMTSLLAETSLDAEQRDHLRTIRLSGEALLALISDTLDYSKIEAGHVELEQQPFELSECVEESIAFVEASAQNKGLVLTHRFAPELPCVVVGDYPRLRQVLLNLLKNAIKFTERGAVALQVRLDSRAGERAKISFAVRDTGIGIPADKHDRIFRRFSQVDDSNTRRYGGTGLGLAISQKLAELMGGTISFESVAGAGSTFTAVIEVGISGSDTFASRAAAVVPPVPAAPVLPAPTEAPLADRMPLRILVTDDNAVNQRVAAATLKKLGYACDLAADGADAVAAHERGPYDLILMDVQMPGVDGLEATRRIRTLPGNQLRPWIVAATAGVYAEDRQKARAAGMNDFINKPLRADLLQEALVRGYQALQAPAAGISR